MKLRAFVGLIAFAAASVVGAQNYPNKPIRMIVPFPPGGAVDIVARHIGQKMSQGLGQPVVVENRSGAGGSIATELAAKSSPDGYTALLAFDTHAVNPHIYKGLRFDTFNDFAPVSLIVRIPLVIATHPSFPASSIKELVAMAKAKPGSISYASVGSGSSGHLAAEQFKRLAGIDLLHVPYKGGAPALTDLMGGQVQLAVLAVSAAVPHIRSGKLKGLAMTGSQRSSALPGIPTMAEQGYPQLDSGAWVGMVVPAGTPAPVIALLNREIAKAIKDPAVSAVFAEQAFEAVGNTPEQFGAFIRSEHQKWGKLIKDVNLNIEP